MRFDRQRLKQRKTIFTILSFEMSSVFLDLEFENMDGMNNRREGEGHSSNHIFFKALIKNTHLADLPSFAFETTHFPGIFNRTPSIGGRRGGGGLRNYTLYSSYKVDEIVTKKKTELLTLCF